MIKCIVLAGSLWLQDSETNVTVNISNITTITESKIYLISGSSIYLEEEYEKILQALQTCPKL